MRHAGGAIAPERVLPDQTWAVDEPLAAAAAEETRIDDGPATATATRSPGATVRPGTFRPGANMRPATVGAGANIPPATARAGATARLGTGALGTYARYAVVSPQTHGPVAPSPSARARTRALPDGQRAAGGGAQRRPRPLWVDSYEWESPAHRRSERTASAPPTQTVTIHRAGAEGDLASAVRRPRRQRAPRFYERPDFRPDRTAMWAVVLGLVLMVVAAATAHAAVRTEARPTVRAAAPAAAPPSAHAAVPAAAPLRSLHG